MSDILARARESLNTQISAKSYGCDMPYPTELMQKMFTEIQRLRDALGDAWDDGNATGLDGWIGPGRGVEQIDDEAIYRRDRFLRENAVKTT